MQFRQQQQQAAAAAAAQADLFARLGRPLPRLPLPLPLPFLHAHMAAAAKFGPSAPFADNLRARFHGFAAAAASASAVAAASNSPGGHVTNQPASSASPPGCLPPPPPSISQPPLNLHPPLLPPRSSPNLSHNSENSVGGPGGPLGIHVGPTSPSCRNPYNDEPMSPNGKQFLRFFPGYSVKLRLFELATFKIWPLF